jgi:hypothetical protein
MASAASNAVDNHSEAARGRHSSKVSPSSGVWDG